MHINFTDKICEKISLWDRLKILSASKPVILYGMGSGADKILNLCAVKNIKINGVFASDNFARGNNFRGFKVGKLSEIEEEYKDFCILTAFATRDEEVINRIYKLDEKYELYAPNFPVFGDVYPDHDFFAGNIGELEKAYSLLSDDMSRIVYANAVNFMISGKIKYLKNICSEKSDALDLLDLREDLYYIDAGAYDGDTIFELKNYLDKKNISIKKITAFEPDKKNFSKLEKNMPENNLSGTCELFNLGVWSEEKTLYFDSKSGRNSSLNPTDPKKQTEIRVNTLDNMINSGESNNGEILIKYDVEGSEYEALNGAKSIIQKYSPKLIVSLYHKNEDIFKLLLLIHSINPNYNFYIRKHRYIPCWDVNLYAVPRSLCK